MCNNVSELVKQVFNCESDSLVMLTMSAQFVLEWMRAKIFFWVASFFFKGYSTLSLKIWIILKTKLEEFEMEVVNGNTFQCDKRYFCKQREKQKKNYHWYSLA